MLCLTAARCIVGRLRGPIGIRHGCITTVHNVTGTQTLVDMPNTKKKDLRRARSGMLNLAPTTTGSATAVAEVATIQPVSSRMPTCV